MASIVSSTALHAPLIWNLAALASHTPCQTFSTCTQKHGWIVVAARANRNLSPEGRELVRRSIRAGRFRDVEEFEDFAVRQAVALLLVEEMRRLRVARKGKRPTAARIEREIRRARRELAREYGIA